MFPDLSVVTFLHLKFIKAVLQNNLNHASLVIEQLQAWGFEQKAKQFQSFMKNLEMS
ncbi:MULTISPECIES: hypothetical protein [Lacticaseibacillus]|uniref:hypothetical protein n=1 Tax=Lacticaseibacillus TaxID=2759736 RepID=UPI000A5000B5|nr:MULTISPECIES: hypothetical protein [Lacticaseibacillus]